MRNLFAALLFGLGFILMARGVEFADDETRQQFIDKYIELAEKFRLIRKQTASRQEIMFK